MSRTRIDHIAILSKNISKSVDWYTNKSKCTVSYQDESWAMLLFDNISVVLVTPEQHPPHFAVIDESVLNIPEKKVHRDGITYSYEDDPDLNTIELIDRES